MGDGYIILIRIRINALSFNHQQLRKLNFRLQYILVKSKKL